MRLSEREAARRLFAHDHGVLGTVHARRGVDAVPVVYAADSASGLIGIPVDRIKQKAPGTLQRERNLRADPRASLLVEHWDREDWDRLWWVRAELRHQATDDPVGTATLAEQLTDRFAQYARAPFDRILVLSVVRVTGWAAHPAAAAARSSAPEPRPGEVVDTAEEE